MSCLSNNGPPSACQRETGDSMIGGAMTPRSSLSLRSACSSSSSSNNSSSSNSSSSSRKLRARGTCQWDGMPNRYRYASSPAAVGIECPTGTQPMSLQPGSISVSPLRDFLEVLCFFVVVENNPPASQCLMGHLNVTLTVVVVVVPSDSSDWFIPNDASPPSGPCSAQTGRRP